MYLSLGLRGRVFQRVCRRRRGGPTTTTEWRFPLNLRGKGRRKGNQSKWRGGWVMDGRKEEVEKKSPEKANRCKRQKRLRVHVFRKYQWKRLWKGFANPTEKWFFYDWESSKMEFVNSIFPIHESSHVIHVRSCLSVCLSACLWTRGICIIESTVQHSYRGACKWETTWGELIVFSNLRLANIFNIYFWMVLPR